MQKDVIYIDVDDDITAIIDKVKKSSHKIIALVPPKRPGVLQSAVNLRLINRAATHQDKRLVIITGNSALAGLSAAASIPVAKTLQSKPELAEITALQVDDDDDIIDGAELPIGEHAKQAGGATAASSMVATEPSVKKAAPPSTGVKPKPKAKKGAKVPNFDSFRKRLVLIALAGLLLVGFLVWAIVFAPHAKIIVSTRTTDAAVSQQVTLSANENTSAANSVIKAVQKTAKQSVSVDFQATQKKDVGERASGSVQFSTDSYTRLIRGVTIPAGTTLTSSSGAAYTTDSTVRLSISDGNVGSTGITASERGEKYNGATGAMDGGPSGISANIKNATSGGTDKTITVASQGDIDSAKQRANEKIDKKAMVTDLQSQFGGEYIVLEDSIKVDSSALKSSIEAGQESTGTPTYGGEVTATLYAVERSVLDDYLKSVLKQQIDDLNTQRVYDTGSKNAKFTNENSAENGITATLATNGKIGPKIDDNQVKDIAAGKRIGDIKGDLEAITGVDSVDVKLSPFWVSKAPKNQEKISVEFSLNDK